MFGDQANYQGKGREGYAYCGRLKPAQTRTETLSANLTRGDAIGRQVRAATDVCVSERDHYCTRVCVCVV